MRNFMMVLVLLGCSAAAVAAGKAFDQKSFEQAAQQGKPVLVMVHADWCPVCRAQARVVDRLAAQSEFSNYEVLRVDFDTQDQVLQQFGVQRQSVLIVFKGDMEVGRTLGDTREAGIATLMRKATAGH
ncbi:MAG: thioredoxin family protein [Methylobacterium sp.]|nr:thioredoxin family protein [Methylobacterium sp.]